MPFEKQWEDLKKIAAEIHGAAPTLLSTEPAPRLAARCGPDNPPWLHCLVRRRGGRTWIFAVNDGDGAGEVTFALEGGARRVSVPAEGRVLQVEGGGFRDRFERLDVQAYEVE